MDDLPIDFEGSLGGPPTNQITGASDTTVNESSVTLDPAVRTVGALQVVQDPDPAPQEGEAIFTTNSKYCGSRYHRQQSYCHTGIGEQIKNMIV
jgi:hypothetical protein